MNKHYIRKLQGIGFCIFGGDHSTSDCSNNNLSKCANCAKAGLIDQHKSYDPKCPVY